MRDRQIVIILMLDKSNAFGIYKGESSMNMVVVRIFVWEGAS